MTIGGNLAIAGAVGITWLGPTQGTTNPLVQVTTTSGRSCGGLVQVIGCKIGDVELVSLVREKEGNGEEEHCHPDEEDDRRQKVFYGNIGTTLAEDCAEIPVAFSFLSSYNV